MIKMVRDPYNGGYVPEECCTYASNPFTAGDNAGEIDDIDLPCGADCGKDCDECVIQRIMAEYAIMTGQA